jgi:Fic family protein
MSAIGYAWIQNELGAPDVIGAWRARLAPVNRIERLLEGGLLVPHKLAPPPTLLQHVLFAIKVEHIRAAPNSIYGRKLGHLWEGWHGQRLPGLDETGVAAAYAPLFDPDTHIVGESRRDARWRIDFNGLGDWAFCPVVYKSPSLAKLLDKGILDQVQAFAQQIGESMLERALSWAYLSETEGSFAIEGETPAHDKATLFAALLKRAHQPRALSEDHLVELQNAVITNPFDRAVQFRTEQNRLQRDVPGPAGVTYVPPPPELACELMEHLMHMANQRPGALDPLVLAAVVSFGFVFIHPFMDGNGRLSRFLIHHCLGQSGRLPPQFLLPISVAMKKHEAQYLQALTSFSRPARELCRVGWAGDEHYTYDWAPGADLWFRYMDLTTCVEFALTMADAALHAHLRLEVDFLVLYDQVARFINERYDVRSGDLTTLIVTIFQNGGVLSSNRRKRFADRLQPQALDAIEQAVSQAMQGRPLTP